MKNLFAILTLCVASVAMAALPSVDVIMDITDPNNVTIVNNEAEGAYGGSYFAIDGFEFEGPVAELTLTGPGAFAYPNFGLGVAKGSDGIHAGLATSTFWMEYGVTYTLGAIVTSSNPNDFYAVDIATGDVYNASFMIADADLQNTLGGTKLVGSIVPEPASMSMLALGALALIRRRR